VNDQEYVERREEALADYREHGADSTKVWKPSSDPNADLIGYSFTCEDGATYTVEETAAWGAQYVYGFLTYADKVVTSVVKPVAVVRRRKELDDARA
jgi:hypothetical protein